MTPDLINGLFEAFGACFLALNVKTLLKDKEVKGVSILPTAFYSSWGFWNLYFYPTMNATWSFYGGILVVITNVTWLILAIKFKKEKE